MTARAIIPKWIGEAIFIRDGYTCVYCGSLWGHIQGFTRRAGGGIVTDHVVPLSKGGTDDPENLVTACQSCNAHKGSQVWGRNFEPRMSLEEALAIARKLPLWVDLLFQRGWTSQNYFEHVLRLSEEIDIYGLQGVRQLREHELFPNEVAKPQPLRKS